jgi:rod shape-determining protein MreD
MSVILSIPALGFIAILQSSVVSRMPLNHGIADLMLVTLVAIALQKPFTTSWQWSIVGGLFTDFLSGLPFGIFIFTYLIVTGFALFIRDRIWRFSFLMQLVIVLSGTVIAHGLSIMVLFFQGGEIPLSTTLYMITLPSLILNFLLSIPIFILVQDIMEQLTFQE